MTVTLLPKTSPPIWTITGGISILQNGAYVSFPDSVTIIAHTNKDWEVVK